jgi:hypothetical protein
MASRYRRRNKKRKTRRRKQRGGAELIYSEPNAAIKVFTSSDKMKPTLETLLASLKKHKYSYEVLGFGKPWKGFETKIENYLEGMTRYAKEKGPDALAIFIDAFDVICIKDSDKLLATYKAKPRPMPVVFGAEVVCFKNCYKDILNWYDTHSVLNGRAAIEADLKPASNSPLWKKPVFMNTGFIMGPVAQLQQMFTEIAQTPFEEDDQYTAGKWAVNHLDQFDLDGEESMIRNKVGNHEKLADEDGEEGPAFLHFPGSRAPEQQEELLKRYAAYGVGK